MINLLKEKEEEIKSNMELPQSEIEKMFDNLGFLKGIDDLNLRKNISFCMYKVYKFVSELTSSGHSCGRFEIIMLPLTRRILTSIDYDGHPLKGDELYLFMKNKKVSDLKSFLNSMREHHYYFGDNEHLSSVLFQTVFDIETYLYGVNDKTIYEAINDYDKDLDNLTDKEKHILNNIIRMDFEAEMTGLTAEYFVFLHQKQ